MDSTMGEPELRFMGSDLRRVRVRPKGRRPGKTLLVTVRGVGVLAMVVAEPESSSLSEPRNDSEPHRGIVAVTVGM